MPGGLFRSESGLADFEPGPVLFEPDAAVAAWRRTLGLLDASRRRARKDLALDWETWRASDPIEVRRAVEEWEGGALPALPSVRSAINRPANQLRDPFLFEDLGRRFLVYALAGEAGLGIATSEVSR